MKPIHRKIQKAQASFVKKLAKQIRPIGDHFTKKQITEINKFYNTNLITANQAKVEVLQMKNSKLTKLFHYLVADEAIKTFPYGNAFNEKTRMSLFICKRSNEYLNFQKEVEEFYASNDQFKYS